MTHFKDDSSPLGKIDDLCSKLSSLSLMHRSHTFLFLFVAAWDCSAWVRTYAQFLEERLECFRVLRYDIETERLTKTSPGSSKVFVVFIQIVSKRHYVD